MNRQLAATWLTAGLAACKPDGLPESDLGTLRLPTGAAVSPNGDWLFVSNGNWDRAQDSSTVVAIDVRRLDAGLDDPRAVGASLSKERPCRRTSPPARLECDPERLIEAEHSVRLGDGAGNIAVDQPRGPGGPLRLLVPTRIDPAVTWIDVVDPQEKDIGVDCGQLGDRRCDAEHVIEVADDPANIMIDELGFRFAYLPHLLEATDCDSGSCAGISLIGLDGERGPELVDVEQDFFREDPIHDSGLRGGFAAAQRACDPDTGNVPSESNGCERAVIYVSQRFWAGIRTFRLAPGLDVVLAGHESSILGVNVDSAIARPLMGDLEFEDPSTGEHLLIVHTTPPGLARVDTSLDAAGDPLDDLVQSLPVCSNPNMLELHRPSDGEWLAFVSCYGDARVTVIGLASFSVVASLDLGAGPNEMAVDEGRRRLYVLNTLESSISIVELDPGRPGFLTEVAVIGLGSERD